MAAKERNGLVASEITCERLGDDKCEALMAGIVKSRKEGLSFEKIEIRHGLHRAHGMTAYRAIPIAKRYLKNKRERARKAAKKEAAKKEAAAPTTAAPTTAAERVEKATAA